MNLLRALATVSGMTLLSRILGFVRDFVIARTFGAGMMTDAFFVAFRLPNLLRRLFAEGRFPRPSSRPRRIPQSARGNRDQKPDRSRRQRAVPDPGRRQRARHGGGAATDRRHGAGIQRPMPKNSSSRWN
jgi:hypothetical protein